MQPDTGVLTITGTGLGADLVVTVDGQPVTVLPGATATRVEVQVASDRPGRPRHVSTDGRGGSGSSKSAIRSSSRAPKAMITPGVVDVGQAKSLPAPVRLQPTLRTAVARCQPTVSAAARVKLGRGPSPMERD